MKIQMRITEYLRSSNLHGFVYLANERNTILRGQFIDKNARFILKLRNNNLKHRMDSQIHATLLLFCGFISYNMRSSTQSSRVLENLNHSYVYKEI
ncbi:CLUMA_CG019342, isoform A [Clunio marinus]|uniref:CLUMA_CG019342, isoform A n=1 Tax=Clunio marinus TaxID=568069 RepID=A0A1J1J2P8_9DIPT|nr:CLUMA_CG019342, isoform A [Clunio marinus]